MTWEDVIGYGSYSHEERKIALLINVNKMLGLFSEISLALSFFQLKILVSETITLTENGVDVEHMYRTHQCQLRHFVQGSQFIM